MLSQFREIWSVDFEFGTRAEDGRPLVRCMCAAELRTGRSIQLWEDELAQLKAAPFDIGKNTLITAYAAHAEMSCFIELGWPVPRCILDPFFEFRAITNGRRKKSGTSLLDALAHYGLPYIDAAEKKDMRALAMRGGPYTHAERAALLDYCQQDVDALIQLLPRMLPDMQQFLLGQILFRGRYAIALARMERIGFPLEAAMLQSLRDHRLTMIQAIVGDAVARGCDVFEGTALNHKKLWAWAAEAKVPWPTTPKGKAVLADEALEILAKRYPKIAVIRETLKTRDILSELDDFEAKSSRQKATQHPG